MTDLPKAFVSLIPSSIFVTTRFEPRTRRSASSGRSTDALSSSSADSDDPTVGWRREKLGKVGFFP